MLPKRTTILRRHHESRIQVVLLLTDETDEQAENACFAGAVLDKHVCFETALAENRLSYPLAELNASVQATRRYIESIGRGNLIDRRVANILYGLSDYLKLERKKVPDEYSGNCRD
jgi:hypothetical protein